jgi:hypothetical protein
MSIQLERIVPHLQNTGKTIWTTVTNYGYRLYTLNMLKSLSVWGLDRTMIILCLDSKSATLFERLGYRVVITDESLERFCAWNTKGYDRICYFKLEWIYRLLSLDRNVLLIDGDIVFLKNPAEDVQKWETGTNDVWIQNDSQNDQNVQNLCTGYMLIRTNRNMISLYDCISDAGIRKYKTCAFDNNDQTYFNKYIKPYIQYHPLPLEYYPNGKMYYENAERLRNNATLIHFNWVQGHMKMAKMKEHTLWLLTEDEEI